MARNAGSTAISTEEWRQRGQNFCSLLSLRPQCDWTARGNHRRWEPHLVSGLVESNRPPEVGSGPLGFLYDPPPSLRLHSRLTLPPVARSPTLPSRVPRISTGRSADQPLQVLLWETFPGFVSSFVFASVFRQKEEANSALCFGILQCHEYLPGRAWATESVFVHEHTGVFKNAVPGCTNSQPPVQLKVHTTNVPLETYLAANKIQLYTAQVRDSTLYSVQLRQTKHPERSP